MKDEVQKRQSSSLFQLFGSLSFFLSYGESSTGTAYSLATVPSCHSSIFRHIRPLPNFFSMLVNKLESLYLFGFISLQICEFRYSRPASRSLIVSLHVQMYRSYIPTSSLPHPSLPRRQSFIAIRQPRIVPILPRHRSTTSSWKARWNSFL